MTTQLCEKARVHGCVRVETIRAKRPHGYRVSRKLTLKEFSLFSCSSGSLARSRAGLLRDGSQPPDARLQAQGEASHHRQNAPTLARFLQRHACPCACLASGGVAGRCKGGT
eukprot:651364-Pleurochrysis_carterae.AAC.1